MVSLDDSPCIHLLFLTVPPSYRKSGGGMARRGQGRTVMFMAKQRVADAKEEMLWSSGEVSDKQQQFLDSQTLFTCYGG